MKKAVPIFGPDLTYNSASLPWSRYSGLQFLHLYRLFNVPNGPKHRSKCCLVCPNTRRLYLTEKLWHMDTWLFSSVSETWIGRFRTRLALLQTRALIVSCPESSGCWQLLKLTHKSALEEQSKGIQDFCICSPDIGQSHQVIHTYIRTHVHTYTHTHICVYVCTYVRAYVCMYVSPDGSALCLENKCKSPGSLCSALPGHSYGSASGAASSQNSPGN